MSKVRAFIAVRLPREIIKKLEHFQAELRSCGARVKWVNADNLHITLKFLGDINYEMVNEISKIIRNSTYEIKPFKIKLKSVGSFPRGVKPPRVIWVGIDGEVGIMEKIYSYLNQALIDFGAPYEKRKFSPHVTIGRVRSSVGINNLVDNLNIHSDKEFGDLEVDKLDLMMSELTPKGPNYTLLASIPFEAK